MTVRNDPVNLAAEQAMAVAFDAFVDGFGPTVTITELPQVPESRRYASHREGVRAGWCRPGEHNWPGDLGEESSPCCDKCGLLYREWSQGM